MGSLQTDRHRHCHCLDGLGIGDLTRMLPADIPVCGLRSAGQGSRLTSQIAVPVAGPLEQEPGAD